MDHLGSQPRLAQLNCYRKADRAEQSKAKQSRADETGGPSRIVRFSLASTSANVTQSSDNQRDEDRDKAGDRGARNRGGRYPHLREQGLSLPLSVLTSASAQPSNPAPHDLDLSMCVCVSLFGTSIYLPCSHGRLGLT